jgi:hypothetical protein
MTAREATHTLVKLGVKPNPSGNGFVVSQNPAPGSPLAPGAVCDLELARSFAVIRP